MAIQKIKRTMLDTGITDSSDANAITIDSSENVTFAGTITGTLATAAQTNITSVGTLSALSVGSTVTVNNTASTSYGSIEMSGTSGAYIDLKTPSSDDFDLRIISTGAGGQINVASGAVALQVGGSSILSATSTGIDVTGTATATNMQVSNGGKYIFGGENTRITGEIDGNGKIRMFTGGTEKVILDGSNVGIGETSPDGELHVKGTGGGNGDVYIERTSGAKIHLQAQSANGKIGTSSNHNLGLNTNATTRVTIDSSGAVGIGVVPQTNRFAGHDVLQIGARGTLLANDTGSSTGQTALLDNLFYNSAGNFRVRDGSNATAGVAMQFVEGNVIFSNSAATSGDPTVLERMRIKSDGQITTQGDILPGADVIMANGRGISFAATSNSSGSMSSELLDDYEEGTWTPTINSGTATGNLGSYTKIGRQVTVTYYLNLTTLGGSQVAVSVGGLPFTSNNINAGSQSAGSVLCRYFTGNQIVSYVYGNTTNINYYDNTSADWDQVTFGEIEPFHDADFIAHGTLTYFAA